MKMKKVALIGKGNLTDLQKELLKKALKDDFEIVKTIETLTSPKDIPAVDAVVTFLMVPAVIGTINTFQKLNPGIPAYVFKIKQLGTFDTPNEELEKIADIKYTKNINGVIKYVYSKTESILKNPKIEIKFEEEISL